MKLLQRLFFVGAIALIVLGIASLIKLVWPGKLWETWLIGMTGVGLHMLYEAARQCEEEGE